MDLSIKQARHFIPQILHIALPIVISQGSQTLILFTDRYFLSKISSTHLAAAMGGGLSHFVFFAFLFGLLSYSTTLVAQYIGAGRNDKAALVTVQAVFSGVCLYPIMLAAGYLFSHCFQFFGHSQLQVELEKEYFLVVLAGAFFNVFNVSISSFFSGIGKTGVVMAINLFVALANVPVAAALVFGWQWVPRLEMLGAALSTVLVSGVGTILFLVLYFSREQRRVYQVFAALRVDKSILRQLFRFGGPSALQVVLNVSAFNLFILTFQSYGSHAASAITILFNWDMVNYIPVLGLQIGIMSLVGRAMGAERPADAEAIALWGMLLGMCYTIVLSIFYLCMSSALISLFSPAGEGYLLSMSMMTGLIMYILADTMGLTAAGALKGAGDTRWLMVVSGSLHWLMLILQFFLIKYLGVGPLESWYGFVVFIFVLSAAFVVRFRNNRWKQIRLLRHN